MKYLLAIDQGTTGSRALLFDRSGRVVTSAYREFPQYFPKLGWVEHDPQEIWQSVNMTIQKVLENVAPHSVAAIGITNQRETTVIWDKVTRRPVHRAIVWQCRRTADRCQRLKKDPACAKLFPKRTGLPVDAYFSATKIEWILKNVPGAFAKARQGRLLFGTTDTWILWKLTQGECHATDYTNASRTMVFNIEKLCWDETLLKIFGIPRGILPQVLPSSGTFGMTQRIGRLPAGIPISGIAGDQQAALFGQTCFEPGTMKNTYGTGAFLLLNTGQKIIRSRHGLITTLACSEDGKPAYALEGSVFIAGAAIQWLRDGIGILSKASESENLAKSLRGNEGVYFVPALVGLGAPHWAPEARGLITGITRGTTRAHVVRAALEAMAYQTRDVFEAMIKDSHLTIRDLKVDGGAAANDFLCQFQSDVLGINIIRPRHIETTSRGAAYLAGLAAGFWQGPQDILKLQKNDKIFRPRIKKSQARQLTEGWRRAVQRTLDP